MKKLNYFPQSDEQYPLLMFVGNEEERTSKVNKRGRFSNISAGAASVMNQWPGHITSTWLTTIFVIICSSIVAIFIVLLAVQKGLLLDPYCKKSNSNLNFKNVTIYLIHDHFPWCQEQLEIVENIAKNYPKWNIEIILIKPMNHFSHYANFLDQIINNETDTTKKNTQIEFRNERFTNKSEEKVEDSNLKNFHEGKSLNGYIKKIFNNKRSTTDKCLHCSSFKNIQQLIQNYPLVKLHTTTFEDVFQNSPLYFTWHNLNLKTKIFAARVLYLWEGAGKTFEIPQFSQKFSSNPYSVNEFSKKVLSCINFTKHIFSKDEVVHLKKMDQVERFIKSGDNNTISNIPEGIVIVDDEGVHMETKTPCHAFLGEIIQRLRQANKDVNPKDIMINSLKKFCVKGGVISKYCQKL